MLQRYLGNKKSILPEITGVIADFAKNTEYVCDAFSGTLSVSMALKELGYTVASNDASYFSYVYGQAFLLPSDLPIIDARSLIGKENYEEYYTHCVEMCNKLRDSDGFNFTNKEKTHTSKEYQGYYGTKDSGNTIKINSQHGSVSFKRQ